MINIPESIFVLRNNDLGDVLVVTPLLHGLRKAFPEARISIGVGDWAKPLLENNSDIDQVISCNGPWHNKQNCRFPANSPITFLQGLLYTLFSKEALYITKMKFTHGIDILGSRQGSWLLRRARIPNRFGVKGYAGGDNWCHNFIHYKEARKVTEAALDFLSLLGKKEKIEPRPRISLSPQETVGAQQKWSKQNNTLQRIVVAPGGGFPEKCWGNENYTALTKLLIQNTKVDLCIIGSKEDVSRISVLEKENVRNLCGRLDLREAAALVSTADFVISNSSLCMHLAGAFKIPSVILLGEWYESAILHHQQWGYPEALVIGKECPKGRRQIATVEEVYDQVAKSLLLNTI